MTFLCRNTSISVNAGKASVIITGIGDYAGEVVKTFNIPAREYKYT